MIVIGAYEIRHEAERKGWVPVLFDLENLDHLGYLRNWGDVLLNAEAVVWRFADIPQSSLPERFFCRPAQDNKLWKAGPTTRSSFWSGRPRSGSSGTSQKPIPSSSPIRERSSLL